MATKYPSLKREHVPHSPFSFQFEAKPIRTIETDGEAWFVASDVCAAIQLPDTHKAVARLDDDEKDRNLIPTPGGAQEMTVINESGLYSLIMTSRKPEAKRFKRWVTAEVLPALRRTGSYSIPKAEDRPKTPRTRTTKMADKIQGIAAISAWLSGVPGVKPDVLAAATLRCLEQNTGIETEPLRNALPSRAEESYGTMNATEVGKHIGLTARKTNSLLQDMGFISKSGDSWMLTQAGMEHGEARPFCRNGHTGFDIQWKKSVVPLLRERITSQPLLSNLDDLTKPN